MESIRWHKSTPDDRESYPVHLQSNEPKHPYFQCEGVFPDRVVLAGCVIHRDDTVWSSSNKYTDDYEWYAGTTVGLPYYKAFTDFQEARRWVERMWREKHVWYADEKLNADRLAAAKELHIYYACNGYSCAEEFDRPVFRADQLRFVDGRFTCQDCLDSHDEGDWKDLCDQWDDSPTLADLPI